LHCSRPTPGDHLLTLNKLPASGSGCFADVSCAASKLTTDKPRTVSPRATKTNKRVCKCTRARVLKHICTIIHTHTRTHTHMHKHTYTQRHMYAHKHRHTHLHTNTGTHAHTHMQKPIQTDTCIYTHSYTNADTHRQMHMQTHTHTRTHTHTHTHAQNTQMHNRSLQQGFSSYTPLLTRNHPSGTATIWLFR